ncbi:S8 family peptidase [Goodfellowiella coeruleoviolacea]|uniref:PA domain-containing protein n=1 Tax=Goodfellowiella coeruleoviolacea TaxID=334858 RepID=A0AAE3KJ66_9PSEU|nr:S8 family serine peptidase [Goodfellowiella coeruleoviolacea]MCP2169956.1 PA domain-containing protein [Goodfellowiella coeruleoviolacea]
MRFSRVPGSVGRVAVRSAVAVMAVALTAGTGAGVAIGQEAGSGEPLAQPVPSADGLSSAQLQLKLSPRLTAAQGKVTAFVELDRQPAVDVFNEKQSQGADKNAAKQAATKAVADTGEVANRVVGQLRSRDAGTKELYRTANGVPGVVVTADAAQVRELAQLPDVKSIRTVVPKTRTNASADQLTKALNVWQQTGRYGDGVRIGIIDTGIDYTHADFGGPGTKEAYQAIDRTKVDPAYFPTAKVVGGIDLVGDDYDANDEAHATPQPDPNPLDCGEHGTHVAGTAGGFGVNADGTTFRGDYGKLTPEALDAMRIGPGTAPKALLYAIKVFGCAGSTNVTGQALDWALDPDGDGDFSDHLDVVNLSLGSDYGAPDDPDSLFVRKLAQNGVVPVFSAGNGGDLYDVGGSPGTTLEALTVASTRDAFVLRDAAEVSAPADVAGGKGGQYSQNYTGYDSLDLTKPVVALTDTANADGCLAYSAADKAAVAGRFVWLEWDDNDATRRCGSGARANNAQAAGAAGAIFSSGIDHFTAGIAGNAAIPVFQFTGTATKQLRPALAAGTLQVRFAGALRASVRTSYPEITDTPSSFTSRGVRGPAVKPDVAAPGDTIASALYGSGDRATVLSGTSMAAPHTTGITALVRQTHPDWTPEEVKAAVMNTAGADVYSGENASGHKEAPQRVGAGRIDAKAAVDNQVLAMVQDNPGAVSVTFGTVEVGGPVSLTKTIKVVNKGVQPVEFGAEYQAITQIPGVSYQLSANSVRLSPRGVATLKVTLRIDDPKALAKTVDPTVVTEQLGVARQFVADASGRVVLTPKSGSSIPLRVPVYSAPKPVADIATADSVRFPGRADQAVLTLRGRGLQQGQGSQAYRSLVSVLELQGNSRQLPECRKNVTTGCTVNQTAKGGDLRYVGAASTAPLAKAQGRPEDALLAFGIVTWGNWYNLGNNTIPFVDIDTTGDGRADFETYVTKPTGTDVLVANTVDLNQPSFPSVDIQPLNGQFGDVDTNVFDTNVAVLPVSLAALGIDAAADTARLSYTVGVSGYYRAPGDTTGLVDQIATPMSFDPLRPGLWVQGGGDPALSYLAKPGTALVVNRNAEALAKDKADNLLVLNHHNASDRRAQVVSVKGNNRPHSAS